MFGKAQFDRESIFTDSMISDKTRRRRPPDDPENRGSDVDEDSDMAGGLLPSVMGDPEVGAGLIPSAALADDIAAARAYRERARAANTLRAYDSDWRQFENWCWARGLEPLPASAEAVAKWLASLARAGKAPSTITRHLAAIGWRHRQDGAVPPQARDTRMVIADTLAGIRREQRARPSGKKTAITAADLARMLHLAAGEGTRATRDRSVLALGLAPRCAAPSWWRCSWPM